MKKYIFLFLLITTYCSAQEIECNVVVNAQAITGVDQKIFKSLQQSIMDFVNQKKWTNEEFAPQEKIIMNLNLNVIKKLTDIENGYEGKLSIQTSRPVYGTDYTTSLINYIDNEVRFKYVQFSPIDFNDNRIAGNDPLNANLSAIIAYYVYLSIGMDYDSYSPKSGTPYFQKAQNIVQNAPEGYGIAGWTQQNEKQKNRYWLLHNIMNPRFGEFRQTFYKYHREGLDQFTTSQNQALNAIGQCIESLNQVNIDNPASAIYFLFFSAKNTEILNFLKKMDKPDREKYGQMLSLMDIPNAQNYLNAKN